jgi:hypothetical protein
MSQSRDESIVRFAAEKVMGWHKLPAPTDSWLSHDGRFAAPPNWNPLDSWADMGMLWEKAAGLGVTLRVTCTATMQTWSAVAVSADNNAPVRCVEDDNSGPRAITEAIVKAFGWKEPSDAS